MPLALPQSARAIGGLQISQHHGQGIGAGCDGKPRQGDSLDFGFLLGRFGEPFRIRLAEVGHQADHGQGLMRQAADTEPADLDQAGQGRGGTNQQPSVHGFDMGAVVGHEPRERQEALLRGGSAAPARAATCPSRRAPDQHGARADQHGRSVDRRRLIHASRDHTVGSRTVKRAPSTLGSPLSVGRDGGAVLGPQAPVVGLDDLLGDRQTQAGVLAEAVVRAVGVEALENLIEGVRVDARTVVVDDDLDLAAEPAGRSRARSSRTAQTNARCRSGC